MKKKSLFNNEVFEKWLDEKSEEILSRDNHIKISNKDLTILLLKDRVERFYNFGKKNKPEHIDTCKDATNPLV